MKATRNVSLLLAIVMLLSIVLSGCASTTEAPAAAESEPATEAAPVAEDTAEAEPAPTEAAGVPEVLHVGTTEELGQLLQYSSASECGAGEFLVYDPIFYYDNNDELASDIITDYHFEDEGYTLVLTMRDDVVFSSGNKATGEDLLFSYASTLDPDRQAVVSNFDYFDFDNSYVGDDGYTVYLKTYDTATAVSQFPMLSLVFLLDKAWVEENGWDSDLWYDGPSGSGPYAVADYLTGNSYTFELREDWWMAGERELPQEIIVTSYSEASTMYMDLENGAISIAIEPSSEDYERSLNDGDNINGALINGNVCNWLVFDYETGPCADINVRKAIAHGVLWEDIAIAGKGVKHGEATSSIPHYFPDYIELGQYEYDPDYARECLAEAGYEPGELTLYMVLSMNAVPLGAVLQAYMADIGINLEFEGFDIATAVPKWLAGEGDVSTFAMQGGSIAHDPYWVYKEINSEATMMDNRTVSDTTIDDCLAKALVASTEEEAHEQYVTIQNWIYDNYRVVSYFEEVNAVCFNTDVIANVHLNSRQLPDLRFIEYVQ